MDIWLTVDGDYSYHWECQSVNNRLYRWDNAPHHQHIATFPHHFHNGEDADLQVSHISSMPVEALTEVLEFIRKKLKE